MNIVIVDDNAVNLMLMAALARSATGIEPVRFDDPVAGLAWCREHGADLIVVDFMMPGMDGHQFIQAVRDTPRLVDVPVVMVTATGQSAVRRKALEIGATDFLTKPVDSTEIKLRLRNLLQLRQAQNLLRDRAAHLAEEVRVATEAIVLRERDLIVRLSRAAEFRDPETGGHIQRMAHYAASIARHMGEPESYAQALLTAAPMHDVGKLGTPDHILLKSGRLDPDELVEMHRHAEIGGRILADTDSPLLRLACEIAETHHEKFDGSGYPRGLQGEQIPLGGRIVAVADVFDALNSTRPYKKAWPLDESRAYIEEHSGRHFDPRCVQAFVAGWNDVLAIRARFPD
ncbi:MAG TPA: HD domain-containing phosphohydrolase [Albitalea sp.]|uniref:HD-GYP domain-containing protein n=1 Tax=Piscinibacter sp. TaxID=1903157 RepID=UPI002ED124A0